MLSRYEYPDELYCDRCETDVAPEIRSCESVLERDDGKRIPVRYDAAFCPVCGNKLCERDYQMQMVNAICKEG